MIEVLINKYYEQGQDVHNRYKSWEHCYQFFQKLPPSGSVSEKDLAALHLAFYLASWGMYRGRSFLLQKDYKVHKYAVDVILDPKYSCLREVEVKGLSDYPRHIDLIFDLNDSIAKAYSDNIDTVNNTEKSVNVTDTLSTKIILGTLGCTPAYDRYFVAGTRFHGLNCRRFNRQSFDELLRFYEIFENEILEIMVMTKNKGLEYPVMKLIDMYFWQVGYILDQPSASSVEEQKTMQVVQEKTLAAFQGGKYRYIPSKQLSATRKYKVPVFTMVTDAVNSLGEKFTKEDIRSYIFQKCGDVNVGTINCYILSTSVNRDARTNWYYNRKERLSNTKYDLLYDLGDGYLERYEPQKHGTWAIKKSNNSYCVEILE